MSPERKPANMAAQRHLELMGLRPTPTLLTMATMVIEEERTGRADAARHSIPRSRTTMEIAQKVAKAQGLDACIRASLESQIGAWRLHVTVPDPPSVEDLAFAVVVETLRRLAMREAEGK